MSKNFKAPEKVISVCTGKSCKKNGSKNLIKLYKHLAKEHHIKDLEVIKTKCTDNCKFAPVFSFQPGNEWHFKLDVMRAESAFCSHFGVEANKEEKNLHE